MEVVPMSARYALLDPIFGARYSADPEDYPRVRDFPGLVLVRQDHPYLTTTGRIVYSDRLLKSRPTLRDLRRLSLPF
jgi:hypothetical protein